MVACLQPGSGWNFLIWWLGKCIYVGHVYFLMIIKAYWESSFRKTCFIPFYWEFYFLPHKQLLFFSLFLFNISFNFKTWVTLKKCFSPSLFFLPFRALAASAPIWQFDDIVPCGVFMEIVTTDYRKSGPNCSECIRRSWDAINRIAGNGKL